MTISSEITTITTNTEITPFTQLLGMNTIDEVYAHLALHGKNMLDFATFDQVWLASFCILTKNGGIDGVTLEMHQKNFEMLYNRKKVAEPESKDDFIINMEYYTDLYPLEVTMYLIKKYNIESEFRVESIFGKYGVYNNYELFKKNPMFVTYHADKFLENNFPFEAQLSLLPRIGEHNFSKLLLNMKRNGIIFYRCLQNEMCLVISNCYNKKTFERVFEEFLQQEPVPLPRDFKDLDENFDYYTSHHTVEKLHAYITLFTQEEYKSLLARLLKKFGLFDCPDDFDNFLSKMEISDIGNFLGIGLPFEILLKLIPRTDDIDGILDDMKKFELSQNKIKMINTTIKNSNLVDPNISLGKLKKFIYSLLEF